MKQMSRICMNPPQTRSSSKWHTQKMLSEVIRKLSLLLLRIEGDGEIGSIFEEVGILKSEVILHLRKGLTCFQCLALTLESDKQVNQLNVTLIVRKIFLHINSEAIYDVLPHFRNPASLDRATSLLDLECKLLSIVQFLPSALDPQNVDIASFPLFGNPAYEDVYGHCKINSLGEGEGVPESYANIKRIMAVTNAAVITEHQQSCWLTRLCAFGVSFPRFLWNSSQSRLRTQVFLRSPSVGMLKNIWNLPERGAIGKLKNLLFQSISVNQQLFIPAQVVSNMDATQYRNQCGDTNIFEDQQGTVLVRLLHHQKLMFNRPSSCLSFTCGQSNPVVHETVILHVHGGGFVALSSSTMQSYTRRWANSLKVPVFSVDYRKPPEHIFPTAVSDLLHVYLFLTRHIHRYVNIKPVKIILAGDSAGGNLVCALMGLILKYQLQPIYGIFLAYPACDTRTIFSPSRLNAFEDSILYPTLLLLCVDQYLGSNALSQYHPLASPLLLTESYINSTVEPNEHKEHKGQNGIFPKNWPRTIIVVGKNDPLLDDSLRLCEKLVKSGVDVHCEIYSHFSHAFLSLGQMLPQTTTAISDSILFLQRLIRT